MGLVPLIYRWAKVEMAKAEAVGRDKIDPEFRLWFSMLGGSIAIPISLFWMAWTSRPDISIWSPLGASVLFGYGILCIFITRCVRKILLLSLCLQMTQKRLTKPYQLQLPIHHRLLRSLRRQRSRISYHDPIRRFGRHGDRRHAVLQEHGRSIHSDHHGLFECVDGACAFCVLQVWTLD